MTSHVDPTDPTIAAARSARGALVGRVLTQGVRLGRVALMSLPRETAIAIVCLVCGVLLSHGGGNLLAVIVMLAVGLAACAGSLAGFAFGAIAGAMLFHLSADTVHVVQIMITCSIANQAAMSWQLRHAIRWRELPTYLAGGTLGVAIGVWLLLHVDRATYTTTLGLFLLGYGVFMLVRKPWVLSRPHPALDVIAAWLSGIVGGAVGFPSAFVVPWVATKGWDKTRQRALFQPYILVMQIASLTTISIDQVAAGGGVGYDPAILLFIPASLLGTAVGMALYRRVSDLQYARIVNAALILSGISYVVG